MKYSKTAFTLVAAIGMNLTMCVSAAYAQCKPAHQLKTLTPGTLTVSTMMLPPYNIPEGSGAMSGVEGDILKKIGEMECLKIHAMQVDTAAEIQYVTTGKADLSAGNWYGTAERAKVLGLTVPIYLDQAGIFSKEGFTKFSELKGKTVGTVQGYNWVPDLQAMYGDNLKLYPTPVALAQDLAAGRVDTGVDSPGAGIYAQKKGGYPGIKIKVADPDPQIRASVEPAQIVFLYPKDSVALGDALNADILSLQKSGEVANILKSYGLDARSANVGATRLIK
ncbi:transporter substrate-binding domain-containing protein [Paraburkholderia caribensis]|uniref:Amino acid ABC transporter n=2 Tax=Paraburkholderia caribensis TaxID=75105 RepID=A0A9Q6S8X9_9BURK|nr:transporter substrate-binding domain-containing protein [Paraburkholderia caribensis]PTB28709.1 amino acid ABC transporter substrate-binding protein [Paraburkholderia caribensis]QLB66536.1 amino acid ABC transporter [Paraburkholderia caribensis]